jgi:hypothetical protein
VCVLLCLGLRCKDGWEWPAAPSSVLVGVPTVSPVCGGRAPQVKQKHGTVDRVNPGGQSAVCKGMFKKETDISLFTGMKVLLIFADSVLPSICLSVRPFVCPSA